MSCKTVSRFVRPALVIVLAIGFASFASATVLVQDDFNDNSIDAMKWTTQTAAGSSLQEAGQHIIFTNGGQLSTLSNYDPDTPSYSGGIKITGQWTVWNSNDMLTISTRSDGAIGGAPHGALNGVNCLYIAYGAGATCIFPSGTAQISATPGGAAAGQVNGANVTPITFGTYNFEVIDRGAAGISFTLTEVANPSNTSTAIAYLKTDTAYGLVSFRDYYGLNAQGILDNVTISSLATPEPSSMILSVTGILGLLAYAWRKRK
jgi:hypothetical protein